MTIILIVSVGLRVSVACYLGNAFDDIRGGTHDQISYDALAQRVVAGYGFSFEQDWWPYARAGQPTAFWSYLYTGYLAAVYLLFGHTPLLARLLQAFIVGVLMPLFLYRIGSRIFSQRVGLLAAAITAVYFYFISYAASLMTEAFYIIGILWTIDIVTRLLEKLERTEKDCQLFSLSVSLRYGLELGLAMGITLLLRQLILFFFLVMMVWLVWVGKHRSLLRPVLAMLLVSTGILMIVLAPWMWRNYQIFGRLTLPNTNAGFTFFWGNHPIYGTRFEPVLSPEHGVSYQALVPIELRDLNEAELDRELMRRGLEFVIDDPGRYFLLSLSRIPVYFLFWPTADSSLLSNVARVLSFGVLLPFIGYGLILSLGRGRQMWKQRRITAAMKMSLSPLFLCGLFLCLYTSIHLASWANVRYRLPVDSILILFAAEGIDHILTRIQYARAKRISTITHVDHS